MKYCTYFDSYNDFVNPLTSHQTPPVLGLGLNSKYHSLSTDTCVQENADCPVTGMATMPGRGNPTAVSHNVVVVPTNKYSALRKGIVFIASPTYNSFLITSFENHFFFGLCMCGWVVGGQ